MSQQTISSFIAHATGKCRGIVQRTGNAEAGKVADDLNVPVVHLASGEVVRSQVGEAPRRETGALRAGTGSEEASGGGEVRQKVYAHRDPQNKEDPEDVAIRLEFGIGLTGPRPFMRPSFNRARTELARQARQG